MKLNKETDDLRDQKIKKEIDLGRREGADLVQGCPYENLVHEMLRMGFYTYMDSF